MLFSSIVFLYCFLPITLLLYYVVPGRYKNLILCLASFFFYAWGEPRFCVLLLGYSLIGYLTGVGLGRLSEQQKEKSEEKRRFLLWGSVILLLGGLVYFKYWNFIRESLMFFLKETGQWTAILLPIGISFYTFQVISYICDVYRGRVKVQRHFLTFLTYVSLFPQLIAGPIVRYEEICDDLQQHRITWNGVAEGIRRFITGLSKKVLLADMLGEMIQTFWAVQTDHCLRYWLIAVGYTLQIYFDFSGYSDMAIGLGRMFGLMFPENFCYPLIADSITDFWKRWHITLTCWFRDYLYIPLGGNRVKKGRWVVNMLLVWLASGLWHGAGWQFLLWGLYYGILLILERTVWGRLVNRLPSWCRHIYTLFFVVISFVIFSGQDMGQVGYLLMGMFGESHIGVCAVSEMRYHFHNSAVLLLIAVIGATPLGCIAMRKLQLIKFEIIWYAGLLFLSTACLLNSSFHPFLYFRF